MTVLEAVMLALGISVLIILIVTPIGMLIGWALDHHHARSRSRAQANSAAYAADLFSLLSVAGQHISAELDRRILDDIRNMDPCPEWHCPDLSTEDRRDGKTCPEHPCTCAPVHTNGDKDA